MCRDSVAASSDAQQHSLTALAPAKINLFLHVVGRRGDGYHLLESLVAFASIGDEITVASGDGRNSATTLEVSGRFAGMIDGNPADNLVVRAASALREATGQNSDVSIRLKKNLPVAAGIGGGSADAAATLMALNDLWALNKSTDELAELGLSLGADVPACLYRTPVMMRGIGEQLSVVPAPAGMGVVLVNPLQLMPTPAVFADFRAYEPFAAAGQFDANAMSNPEDWCARLRTCTNSLEPPAGRLLPGIGRIVGSLDALPDCRLARMSGSGATCFGLFDSWDAAARNADRISVAHPGWWVAPGRILT